MREGDLQQYLQFKKRYEEQAGQVWLATDCDEAVAAIRKIILQAGSSKAAYIPLTPELDRRLPDLFTESSIEAFLLENKVPAVAHRVSEVDVGISPVAFGIAFTGTVVEITTDDSHRLISSLPRIHIALLGASDILPNLTEAAMRLRKAYAEHSMNCNITFISGPSRTADIEMKLFLGVHGPQESHVIVRDW
ncbi:lactate utilization protein [bacterium]|nr:lactate utilization protein [bacterium]